MTFALLGFVSFLFFRIASVLIFGQSISLVACALMAIITVGILLAAKNIWNVKINLRIIAALDRGVPDKDRALEVAARIYIVPLFAVAVAQLVINWLIVLGFSESFYREIVHSRSYRGIFNPDNAFALGLMLLAPVALVFLLDVARTYRFMKSVIQDKE